MAQVMLGKNLHDWSTALKEKDHLDQAIQRLIEEFLPGSRVPT